MIDNNILLDSEIRELHGDNLREDSNKNKHLTNKNIYYEDIETLTK